MVNKQRIFTIIIAIFPLLSVYRSPIPGLDIGSLLLILFFIWIFPRSIHINCITPIILYVTIITPFVLLASTSYAVSIQTIVLRYLKFIIIVGPIFAFGLFPKFFNERIALTTIKKVVYVSAIFVVLQRVMFLFGKIIMNPLLPFANYEGYTEGYTMLSGLLFRPSAFFLEPAHLSLYCFVSLVYTLLKENNIKASLISAIAILLTGSGIGLMLTIAVYYIFFFSKFNQHIIKALALSIFGGLFFLWLGSMDFFQEVIARFTTNNINGGGNAIDARIGEGYQLFFGKPIGFQLFGNGYGNVPLSLYMNGTTYILNTLGIIGLLFFLYTLFQLIKKGEMWQKVGIVIFLALTIFSQTFTPASIAFYFCVFYNFSDKKENYKGIIKRE